MKRILGTTAIILSLTGPAFADAHAAGFGTVTAQETDFFASDLIGMRIYNSETEVEANSTIAADGEKEWDDIGEINDVLLDSEGNVKAVILGIGGFLGMGERDVSVNMDEIRIVTEEGDSDDRFLVVNTSKEMLEKAKFGGIIEPENPEIKKRLESIAPEHWFAIEPYSANLRKLSLNS